MKESCLIFIVSIILILVAFLVFDTGSSSRFFSQFSTQKKDMPSSENLIETLIKQNYVIIRCDSCKVFIDQVIWSESDSPSRENLTVALAKYVKQKTENHKPKYFVDIYEKQSGKKLANWKSDTGYTEFNQ